MNKKLPNLNHHLVAAVLAFSCISPAAAVTCDAAYYLESGTCERCTSGYYCPGDDTRIQCPRNTQDWAEIYTNKGHEVISILNISYFSWGNNGAASSLITHCRIGLNIQTTTGTFYIEPPFNGSSYSTESNQYWHTASAGNYLSPYFTKTWANFYHGTKPCTNAIPTNSHYSGPGTPDAPDGSITNANDCPWECDAGYYLSDGTCKECESGYYCPGDNTQIACPTDTNDWWKIFADERYDVKDIRLGNYMSWSGKTAPTGCHRAVWCDTSTGAFYSEPGFNGTAYDPAYNKLWYAAEPGYYLSLYAWTSNLNWYRGTKPCSNAIPTNSHYSGPGTPDEPKAGGITDYNDCPWACDGGYYLTNSKCEQCTSGYYCPGDNTQIACPAGTTTIGYGPGADETADCGVSLHIGDATVHLRSEKRTTPALHVRVGNQTFYGDMTTATKGKVRAKIDDTVYSIYDDSM